MMKFIGTTFLSLVPLIFCVGKRQKIIEEGKLISSLFRFFEHLSFQLVNFLKDQEEIFSGFDDPFLEKISFLPRLKEEVEQDPVGALERSIFQLLEESRMDERCREMILDFALRFGMQAKSEQIADCQRLVSFLKEEVSRVEEKAKREAQALLWTGFCAGAGLFVVMI